MLPRERFIAYPKKFRHDAVPVEDTGHEHAEGEKEHIPRNPRLPSATENGEGEGYREDPERAPARAPEPEVAAITEDVGEPEERVIEVDVGELEERIPEVKEYASEPAP